MEKNLLKIKDIALLYGVSVQTIYRWIEKYELEGCIINGTKHIDLEELKLYEELEKVNETDQNEPAGGTGGTLDNDDLIYNVVDEDEIKLDLMTKYQLLLQENEHLKEINLILEDHKRDLQEQNGYLIADNIKLQSEIKALEAPERKDESLWSRIKKKFFEK